MNNFAALLFITTGILIAIQACQNHSGEVKESKVSEMYQKAEEVAPVCKKKPVELKKHDDTRIDNYYWLNDREDEEVISYLNSGETHTARV